ncbi:MAG TPA: polysaccharide deacetylase family protein [Patescibacteria group bacterium]|nr:polysaccharide deacetylase family protein [Patescibacteria group bacterium]
MSDSVLLTFDDYGTEQEITEILSTLENKNVKAAFFLQGDWAQQNKPLVELIRQHGHVIGNHTFSHPILRGLPDESVRGEIQKGLPGPWLRPPQGRYDKKVRAIAARLGYVICYWSIDSCDWAGATVQEMRHTILHELHPGAVILFHLHGKHTRELLPGIIDDIRAAGYELTPPTETWHP